MFRLKFVSSLEAFSLKNGNNRFAILAACNIKVRFAGYFEILRCNFNLITFLIFRCLDLFVTSLIACKTIQFFCKIKKYFCEYETTYTYGNTIMIK